MKLSLVIPLYNEEANVEAVAGAILHTLRAAGLEFELVLVDNGSRDRTAALIDRLGSENPEIRKVTVAVNQGYGWGVLQGLRAANGQVLGFMGGDGQTDPADIPKVYRKLVDEDLPLAKVRRVRRHDGAIRILVTLLANLAFFLAFRLRTTDVNGTPKLMRRELYESLDLQCKDWFVDAEVMIKCARRGVRFAEVPVTFGARERGSSNVRLATIVEFLRNIGRSLSLK